MRAHYLHTNLTVANLEKQVAFYCDVFGCTPVRAIQSLEGPWLDAITGIVGARLRYVHLRLPGHGAEGPELELNEYGNPMERPATSAARIGYGHLAFRVDDVEAALGEVVAAGGGRLGEVVTTPIPGRGVLTEVYAVDPEGNILELQRYAPE
jgi:catechol 2,3-dioxygenase-like lactoylglutathione lyase family enzyme